MDKTLRTAATGLSAQQKYVEIISNNLANVNTTGFKKVRPEFQDLLYETLRPAGNVGRSGVEPLNEVQIGSGTELTSTTKQFKQGDVASTGRALDVAINGEGFFLLRRPDNSFVYSRDGSFKLNRNGEIVNSQGYSVQPGFRIPQDAQSVKISGDGVVSYLEKSGTEHQSLGQMELARFVNPGGLRSIGSNLFVETPASGQATYEQAGNNNTGTLLQNHLETSNVDIVEEMVNMITAQRAYELNSKAVQTADSILSTSVNLKR